MKQLHIQQSNIKQSNIKQYDVGIIGGGPAGLATALMLRQHNPNYSIAVFESSFYQQQRVGESVAPGLEAILQTLGAQHLLENKIHTPSAGVKSCWGSEQANYQDFLLFPRGRGWHLERSLFDASLAAFARANGIDVYCGHRYQNSEIIDGRRQLVFNSIADEHADHAGQYQSIVSVKFTVDAGGRAAKFSQQQGSSTHALDSLVSIYTYLPMQPKDRAFSIIESFEHGWWYSASLPNNQKIVAMMTDSDLATKYRFKNSSEWLSALTKSRHLELTNIESKSLNPLKIWPAYSLYRDEISGDDWLTVGDAAVCYDPLSSQGIVKSMQQGIYAAHAINDYLLVEKDGPQHDDALQTYVNSCSAGFKHYYSSWCKYYRQEQQWPLSLFWKRRFHIEGGLNPQHFLQTNPQSLTTRFTNISQKQFLQIQALCNGKLAAWEVVNALKAQWNNASNFIVPDELIINMLQYLIDREYLMALATLSEDKQVSTAESL